MLPSSQPKEIEKSVCVQQLPIPATNCTFFLSLLHFLDLEILGSDSKNTPTLIKHHHNRTLYIESYVFKIFDLSVNNEFGKQINNVKKN